MTYIALPKKITRGVCMIKSILCTLSVLFLFVVMPFSQIDAASIKVVTFNVLGPIWADPALYPPGAPLDREYRRARIISALNNLKKDADNIALQEVVESEFPYYLAGLGNDWVGLGAYHDPNYWSNWLIPSIPWEPNGVAIFVNRKTFKSIGFSDNALSDSGNHAALFIGVHKSTNKQVRAFSVHLDSDHAYNRNKELAAALGILAPKDGVIDVIAGDINFETDTGNLRDDLNKALFVDILHQLGTEDLTSPYATSYYKADNWGIIDHVIIRNGSPKEGYVVNYGLYEKYPIVPSGSDDPRIIENFQIDGSDHFPVVGSADI
jgi:endonuclease/exonuclease/phosphatase family metal-dependent hydrolase